MGTVRSRLKSSRDGGWTTWRRLSVSLWLFAFAMPLACELASGEDVPGANVISGGQPSGPAGPGATSGAGGGGQTVCNSDVHCELPTPACDVDRGVCVECTGPQHCDGDKTCDPLSQLCLRSCSAGCAADELCDAEQGVCVKCLADADCPDVSKPACWRAMNTCAECTNSAHCTDITKPTCDLTVGKCIECQTHSECAGGQPWCDPVEQKCVECLLDSHCGAMTCDPVEKKCL